MARSTKYTFVRYADYTINRAVYHVTNIQYRIKGKVVKLLDSIVDKFNEYQDYLQEANDTIGSAFDKLKGVIASRVHK